MIWCQTLRLRQLLWSKAIVQPNGFLSPLVLERLFDLGLSCSRLSCTSPAPLLHLSRPLLHLSWPLLHLSCTSPAPLLHLSCTSPDLLRLSWPAAPLLTCCASLPCPSAAPLLHVSLLHLSWNFPAPLLHLSCTSPAPLLTPAAPLFPAPLQQKLEGFPKDTSNHFKTNAKLCKAFICFFYIKLSGVVTCWACMAPLLHLSCTSPAPFLHLSWPLLHLSVLHLSSRS